MKNRGLLFQATAVLLLGTAFLVSPPAVSGASAAVASQGGCGVCGPDCPTYDARLLWCQYYCASNSTPFMCDGPGVNCWFPDVGYDCFAPFS
jgi:hypothetical protein